MTMTLAIDVTGLRKSFGDTVVLDGIDLAVTEGTVFSLLGPNGAGKTTTVEMCEGFIKPDAGSIEILGLDPVADNAQVRVVAYDFNLPDVVDRLEKLGANVMAIIDNSGDHGKDGSAENEAETRLVASAGRAVQVGMSNDDAPVRIGSLTEKELDVLGASCCTSNDFAEAIRIVEGNPDSLPLLISHEFALGQAPEAIRFAMSNPTEVMKVVIRDE